MRRLAWTLLLLAGAAACSPAVAPGDAGDALGQDARTDRADTSADVPGLDAGHDDAAGDVGRRDALAVDVSTVDTLPIDAGPADPLDPAYQPPVDTDPAHYPANVWITGPLEKVQPSATPGPVHWALLSSARNEFESFQVHVHAQGAPVALSVTVGDLVDARSGRRIDAAANVLVSREAYIDIATPSDANGVTGRVPDPLIPTRDPVAHEPRNAFPVTVPDGETRSAWIDVLVPADAPSGYYTGRVTVSDGARTLATLPLRVKVWDFALPSTATLRSAFGLSRTGLCLQAYGSLAGCANYPGANGSADHGGELAHASEVAFFLDYRLTLSDVAYSAPSDTNWSAFDALYGPLLDGAEATRLAGARVTSIRYRDYVTDASAIQRWVDHFGTRGWLPRLFEYHCDEPPRVCSWSQALTEAEGVHAASPDMRTLLTADYAGASANGLLDAVDILTPVVDDVEPRGQPNQRPSYDAWLQRPNKHLFWYQSCDEHESCSNGMPGPARSTWPSYMVDASPVRNRVFQWLAYLDAIEGELYYSTDLCWNTACGAGSTADPWTSVYQYGGNGDGTLFYPGTPARIGGTTPVPVASVRLTHLRDGMEDYEYLHALDAAGDSAFATSTARGFITNAYTFDNDPARMTAAREALGDRLHRRAYP